MYGICALASQFLVGDSTICYMTHRHLKAVSIANEVVFLGAIVIPENLFVEVAKQVKRFDIDIRTFQTALEKTPEILGALLLSEAGSTAGCYHHWHVR